MLLVIEGFAIATTMVRCYGVVVGAFWLGLHDEFLCPSV